MRWRAVVAGVMVAVASVATAATASDLDAAIGFRLFKRAWVPAPASTGADDGLGPLFNARSCLACHAGLARGAAALDQGMVLRLGDADGRPDPRFGAQVQTQATQVVAAEARAFLVWRAAGDGLRRPAPRIVPASGALAPTTRVSARVAPSLALVAAIAAVDDTAIAAGAAASAGGRVARLGDGRVGRFGWKASEATLADFTERAFSVDMGLSTHGRPAAAGDCTAGQTACLTAPGGYAPDGRVEIDRPIVAAIARFLATRPAPRAELGGGTGAILFAASGCVSCHVPALGAGDGTRIVLYSDLLLHDLGPGLDDGVGEGAARAADWRTAPLVGLGAARGKGLLHDGRARDIDEAVRWHGGGGAAARAAYLSLAPAERRALIAFLETL